MRILTLLVTIPSHVPALPQVSVSVQPLLSGYSSDAHGLLNVSHKMLARTLQFKLGDAAIRCTVVGDRTLVL